MDSGTIVAFVPMVLPTINLEIGKTNIINMINGNDLSILVIPFSIWFNTGFSHIPLLSVIVRRIPIGNPSNSENIVEKKTIYSVSNNDGVIKSNIYITSNRMFSLFSQFIACSIS